jgi:hypothetical protein
MSTVKRIMEAKTRRVDALRKALADLQQDMDTRRFLMTHSNRGGRFCDSCSRKRQPDKCDNLTTCALLRPAWKCAKFFTAPEVWRRETRAVLSEYKALLADMDRFEYNISKPELEQWEDWAEQMLYDGKSNVEKIDNEEPPSDILWEFGVVDYMQLHAGPGLDSDVSLKDASRLTPEQIQDWVEVQLEDCIDMGALVIEELRKDAQ